MSEPRAPQRPFYSGETIDLVVPTRDDATNSSWPDWFNSQRTNRYTQHAIFPNTIERQVEFYETLQKPGRIALLVATKSHREIVGTVSLSGIDFRSRTAAIAIVMDTESETTTSPLASLEAMAIMTQHGFDALGLDRIEAGQVYPALRRWNQILEIIGYRSEGFKRHAFVRGHDVSDEVTLACLVETYDVLVERRGGSLWPGASVARELIKALPTVSFAERLDDCIRTLEADYFAGAE